ncbi:MAG: PKD domain-containing protein [Jatrophihabitantaceae bacterium]
MNTSTPFGLPRRKASFALRAGIIATTVSLVIAGLAAPAGAAPTPKSTNAVSAYAQTSAGRVGTTHYAVIKPACAEPSTPGGYTCMALERVNVPKGTKGAKAYVDAAVTAGPAGGFTPADLAWAYQMTPSSSVGSSQTIAIIDWNNDSHARADLNLFDKHYRLPAETATSLRIVNQTGGTTLPPITSDTVEITLDIESARAVCNKCKILLVEATAPTSADLAVAVNTAARLGATEISNSYGAPENTAHPDPASIVNAYNHPGVVITASTGDDGWFSWDHANVSGGRSSNGPSTPASYPSVVSVAGTALALNADGSRQSEQVWNENGLDDESTHTHASGGGCSTIYAAPSFQRTAAGYAATGCNGKNMVGDVAAVADPYTGFDVYDSANGGWLTVGGTSLASPIVAALWGLAGGARRVASPAQALYDNYRLRPTSLYDVTLGGNGFCAGDTTAHCEAAVQNDFNLPSGNPNGFGAGLLDCSFPRDGSAPATPPVRVTECNASVGYDGASGVGAPQGLNALRSTVPTVAIAHPALMKLNTTETFKISSFSDPVGHAVAYSWSYGDGSAATTSTSHVYRKAGTFTVSMTVTDSVGQRATARTVVTMGRPMALKINGPAAVHHGGLYRWTMYGSSDPNTGARFLRYVWNWGDGTSTSGSPALTHRYARIARRVITLTVSDSSGVRTVKKFSVNVVR